MDVKKIIVFTIIFMTACAVYQPIPGLCYTDKTGTYLCPEEVETKRLLMIRVR
tara:strand:- start:1355 stop:1513 length:159 start_codon:yes stop_codon:yes gene_type:complete